MLTIREATAADRDFLVGVDRKDESVSPDRRDDWGPAEVMAHQRKIAAFVSDEDKAAWVFEDTEAGRTVAMILWRYRNRRHDAFASWDIFPELDESLFPPDGAFAEIFQLWVAPLYRRRGLATHLKRLAESEALARGVGLIYTHTEERNEHVLELNRKLGYREVRRGSIWDEVVRVSLIKRLGGPQS